MVLAIYGSVFATAYLLGLVAFPLLEKRFDRYLEHQASGARVVLDDMFVNWSSAKIKLLYGLTPLVAGLIAWVLSYSKIGLAAGLILGFMLPSLIIRQMRKRREKLFQNMLVDTLLLMSSCLRAGLSMLQSFTVVAEEMPPPINQEVGLLLKEIRMGVTLDDALEHFRTRNPSDEMNLFITAVLVARETGGDVTMIFAKLVETLRERKKIKEKITTLTFMAKAQGLVMALLPIVFMYVVYKMDPGHIRFFLFDPMGQVALGGVIVAQLVVLVLFIRFSRSPL